MTAEGKEALRLASAKDLRSRLADLWSSTLMDQMVTLHFTQGPVSVQGLINAVPAHQPTKTTQHLFVNGRPVQQRALTHAIYEAYHEWLPVGRHPAFVLFVNIDPALVDVNVHPTKREVRFSNERATYDLLFQRIRKVLQERQEVPVMGDTPSFVPGYYSSQTTWDRSREGGSRGWTQTLPLVATQPEFVSDAPSRPLSRAPLRILGQYQKLYVLVEQGDELLIVDQHAAAERVLYEKLLAQAKKPNAPRQALLTPYLWEVTPDQAERVQDVLPDLGALGFGLESFGPHTFALKEWPADLPELKQAKRFLDIFLESLENDSHDHEENARHARVASAACRAAIKANDGLALEEMTHLLEELSACERPMTCPHGRPTHIRLPLAELHRRFHRT